MEPTGVRMACPQCTWSCVMRAEDERPDGVNRLVEGVPYCPNCQDMPMEPIASVNVTERPSPGLAEGLSLAERLQKIREAQLEVGEAKEAWDDAKEAASSARKRYDGQVESLGALINRLTAVPGPRPPLLEVAEQASDAPGDPAKEDESMCVDGEMCSEPGHDYEREAPVICTRPAGHLGAHIAHVLHGVQVGREVCRWAILDASEGAQEPSVVDA